MKTISLKQFANAIFLMVFIVSLPVLSRSQSIFEVEIQGLTEISDPFRVILPESSFEFLDDVQASENLNPDFQLGRVSNTNLIIKRKVTNDHSLYDWYKDCREGRYQRRGVTVIAPEVPSQRPEWRINFYDALPVKYIPATVKNGILIETIELQFNWFDVE